MISLKLFFLVAVCLYTAQLLFSYHKIFHTPEATNVDKPSTYESFFALSESITDPSISPDFSDNFSQKHDTQPLTDEFVKQTPEDGDMPYEPEIVTPPETLTFPVNPKPFDLAKRRQQNPFFMLGAYPNINSTYQEAFKYNIIGSNRILNNNDYCNKVDLYNLKNPQDMLNRKSFFTDFPKKQVPRSMIMEKIGFIPENPVSFHKPTKLDLSRFNKTINSFFVQSSKFHHYHKIGTHFLCATQMYNHIPGQNVLTTKDQIVESINRYTKQYDDKPQCLRKDTLFPKTYRLYDKEECKAFLKHISSHDYKESLKQNAIQFVIKVGHGVHKSDGVFLLDKNQTRYINSKYRKGNLCGKVTEPLLAQAYVSNPLLLDMNNKFDFRVYMLIASTNPLIVYYRDGLLKASLYSYEKNSTERATHLTNIHLSQQKIQEVKGQNKTLNGMNETELAKYIMWEFDELQEYLLESGKITDPEWLDNYLRPTFHRAFIHLARVGQHAFWKQSNVYSLQGVDFMLDDNLELWFIESNPSPLLTGTQKYMFFYQVVKDHFEIQFAYYRSRMQRTVDVIERMQMEQRVGGAVDYKKWRKEYRKAIQNRIEPEYQISEKNGFKLVLDENLVGPDAYMGYLPKECL